MFETTFSHASSMSIPPNQSVESAVSLLHDFETVIKLSPNTRGCKPVQPNNGYAKSNGSIKGSTATADMQFWEVEDDLPFIPKKLWSGGVRYRAEFLPVKEGCDITVHAPGGFTSTNHWRMIRDPDAGEDGDHLKQTPTKDMLYADQAGAGWYVQLISDAECNKTFAGFVKGFLKNVHATLKQNFIEKLKETPQQQQKQRRPTLGRRNSSVL